MGGSLDELIVEQRESLVDGIVKDAVRQIPSYGEAPLRLTIERVEGLLDTLATSIDRNDPDILEQYLIGVAGERKREGYAILELHGIVHIIEQHLQQAIRRSTADEVEQNGLLALTDAVMDAARIVLSVRYMLASSKIKI